MTTEELSRLLDAGDLHGLLLAVAKMWLEKYHPESDFATVTADMGEGVPSVIIPILPRIAASPAPGRA